MKISFIICLLSLIFLVGCPMEEEPAPDTELYIINNSNSTIVHEPQKTRSINDTMLWESMPWRDFYDFALEPGEVRVFNLISIDVKRTLEKYHIHEYFFYADTLSAYPWDVIRDEYKVAKRVTISSWEEYEAMDFTIEFP